MRLALALAAIAVAGCAADPARYAATPPMELCVNYMTLPSANVWQPSRAAAIQQRGIDCSQYVGVAAVQQQSNQQALDAITRGAALQKPAPVPQPQVVCRQIGPNTVCQ